MKVYELCDDFLCINLLRLSYGQTGIYTMIRRTAGREGKPLGIMLDQLIAS